MGMYAEIIAIGPFSKDILEYMEYSEVYYRDTKEGAIITRVLFGVSQGTTVGHEFANCFGITDGWDFNQHKISNSKVDLELLKAFVLRYDEYEDDYKIFKVLLDKGFEFHFAPNG